MTPQEKELIQGVFDRLARAGGGPKDPEAEALIRAQIAHQPDAAYGLVQAVIVQEMGLNQAQQKINELQRQLEEARVAQPAAAPASFLGGAAPSPWGGGSVPSAGSVRPAPQPVYAPPPQPQQAYAPPPQYAPQPSAWAQPAGGGGFLRSAATMAAGVAGGTLIAEGISSMFGGHHGGGFGGGGFGGGGFAGGSPWGGGGNAPTEIVENTTVNNYYGDQGGRDRQDVSSDPADQGAAYQDASFDTSGDPGFDSDFDDSSDI